MPIYEYQCQSCGEQTEVIRKLSDEPLVDCPSCGEPALKKKVSAAAFRLKGGGWYETDFKTGDKKNLAGGDEGNKGAAADSKTGDGKTGDGKPGDSKAGDSKAGDSKPGKSTSGDGGKSTKTA
jgi:putative FmdB family regulatory protein